MLSADESGRRPKSRTTQVFEGQNADFARFRGLLFDIAAVICGYGRCAIGTVAHGSTAALLLLIS